MSDLPPFGYHFAILHRLKLLLCKDEIIKLGIQLSQMPFILGLSMSNRPMTQDDLSALLIIDKAATTRSLNKLEKLGFITRRINPNCRRQNLVELTPKARKISAKLNRILRFSTETMAEGFSGEELELFHQLLNRMINNAKSELEK